ncbi:tetratricopeptide repeat protein [Pelagicoccus albus]|uniref:Tetratricopeptide repeat protein n=1 Tax=Pelagicoccus albus TaxID=415222 RepID=A0A7X1E985_9BACT|nr:tetratricopeptide repeat protein [Pelagicoccus albus]
MAQRAFCVLSIVATHWVQAAVPDLSSIGAPRGGGDFFSLYSANTEIEPDLSAEDLEFYQEIAPLLNTDTAAAIELLKPQLSEESSAGFDFILGSLLYVQGDMGESIVWLERAVEKMPNFRRAHRMLGLCRTQLGEEASSIEDWKNVITLGGGDAQSYGLLGYAYLSQENYYSALKAYEMARLFDADSRDFKQGLAQCLLMTGQREQAISLYDELLKQDPKNAEFWLLQANAYVALDRRQEAIANIEFLREMEKVDWASLVLLGDLYLARGAYELAVDRYLESVENADSLDKEKVLLPLERLLAYRLFEEANSFIAALDASAGIEGEWSKGEEYQLCRAQVAMEMGDFSESESVLKSIVQANPVSGQALLLLGDLCKRTERSEEAVFFLERAAAIDAVEADALLALGRLEVERGRLSEGIKFLKESQKLRPRENVAAYLARVKEVLSLRKGRKS